MKQYELWLKIAARDLEASNVLLNASLTHQSAYFAQQAGEKALKGYLVAQKRMPQKTHNLKVLLIVCTELLPSFAKLKEAAHFLSPHSTNSRYPENYEELYFYEAAVLLKHAQKILKFVAKLVQEASW
ncbi:HEPN domain-containing protein [Candidatus Dependentiae bacterium]|nr:HEPN domain-containing protein [Candidatus Dependentiae bacterium]